jgi:hypothetical protein
MYLNLTTQSVLIATEVVNLFLPMARIHSIQHLMIKFVNDWRQVKWFFPVSSIKTDHQDITEILLKGALHSNIFYFILGNNPNTKFGVNG